MPIYGLYHLHPETSETMYSEAFEAPDDEAALAETARRDRDHVREVWREGQKVGRLEADPPAQ